MIQSSGQQDQIVKSLAQKFGLEEGKADAVLAQVTGALGGGVEKTAQQDGGLQGLASILNLGKAQEALDDPRQLEQNETAVREEGNNILSQLQGSKDASRDVASQISNNTGVDNNTIQSMLPMIATMAMGAMGKKAGGMQNFSSLLQGANAGNIMSMFDQDNDGSVVDDAMGMLGGLIGKK